jgi:hypothetical protein
MPNRIIKESICSSEQVHQLKPDEEVLFYRLIVNCDDYGCIDSRPAIIRSKCYPLQADDITLEQIVARLKRLVEVGLVVVYVVEGAPYLKLATWERHQQIRAKRPRYPLLDDNSLILPADDITCNQLASTASNCASRAQNPNPIRIQSESNPNPNPNPNLQTGEDLFPEFWTAYPRKQDKGHAKKAWAKLKVDRPLLTIMLNSIVKAKESDQWVKDNGKFIPFPATWLHGEGWTDEYPENTGRRDNGSKPQGMPGNDSVGAIDEHITALEKKQKGEQHGA